MKKIFILLLVSVFLTACENPFFSRKIVIKGQIASLSPAGIMKAKSDNQLRLADASKVLIFYGNEYSIAEIKSDGTFSAKAKAGSATVVVFLTSDNRFIGNLFAGGLHILPLVGIDDDLSVIDLSTLTLDGTRVIPANNPLATDIVLTAKEYDFMKEVSSYYEVLAGNIDMDKNGTPDIIDENNILVNAQVYVNVGNFGRNNTAPVLKSNTGFNINKFIRIEGDLSLFERDFPIKLEGPASHPYSTIVSNIHTATSCFIAGFQHVNSQQGSPQGGFLPFEDGVYTFTLSSKNTYTFTHLNVDMGNYMVIVIPTIRTNNSGYITTISYDFQLPDGAVVDPRKLLSSYIRLQINDAQYRQLYEGKHLYGSYLLDSYDFYTEKIDKRIKLSDVKTIGLAYIDLLGNEYQMNWDY